ncbi:hypothetical protein LEP1GSC016_2279 [Leptospira borgpetersenii serovar Hardjo-bovis str. Sponselee]|uniref:Uncharacterized protein n=1 Tax=Leptospira borgpetersenii serovar Hardjo-bovis str. Sponselee TaxID=1303729 RepID=M6CF71_LEPBO|nr:hypothetical protein LEP1GSC016_2279 [Leptospira borgpetersenii serovar Hardjo-bovis str. Sponselee]
MRQTFSIREKSIFMTEFFYFLREKLFRKFIDKTEILKIIS